MSAHSAESKIENHTFKKKSTQDFETFIGLLQILDCMRGEIQFSLMRSEDGWNAPAPVGFLSLA